MSRQKREVADYEFPANQKIIRYDERGAIIAFGEMARGIVWDMQDRGERIMFGDGRDDLYYVDLTGVAPRLMARPVATWRFDKTEMLPRQEAVMKGLPPASVRFTGPSSGSQAHEKTGDLAIGWTVPGDYLVQIDCFPYTGLSLPLKVVGASVKLEAKL